MKALITGLNGTVAPVLAEALREAGHQIIGWDRSAVPTDSPEAALDFIRHQQPDWFFHLATGSADWAESVARICGQLDTPFLFTSSVSVFASSQRGPFDVDTPPNPNDDYGRYKRECEVRILNANPDARVVRIGWQIGAAPGRNHMVDHLEKTFAAEGRLTASTEWYQACSFLPDTARALLHVMQSLAGGLYHLDGNPGLCFFDIVTNLNTLHGGRWVVEPSASPTLNNRMLDERVTVGLITARF
jgi:dTDP-4-dehydrorhamnose reductase